MRAAGVLEAFWPHETPLRRTSFYEAKLSATIIDLAERRSRLPQEQSSPPAPPVQSDLEWRLSKRGNPYVVVNDAFHVVLFRGRGSAWAFRIEELETEQAWFSERRHETVDAAWADAFLAVRQLQGKSRLRRTGPSPIPSP
jgi:hypothetical protein